MRAIVAKIIPNKAKKYLFKNTVVKLLCSPRPTLAVAIILKFLFSKKIHISFAERLTILRRFFKIDKYLDCAHSFEEYLIPAYEILTFPSVKGHIIEAGAFKGGGTAKLSIIAKICNRKLFVFDSFEGLPENNEPVAHTTLGGICPYNKGEFSGSLDEVRRNVEKFGEIEVCSFVKGWFDTTMPTFREEVITVFCDVDLESSTKTVLKNMWPNLVNKGFFFSQDAHIPIVLKLFSNQDFWRDEIGQDPPRFVHFTKRLGYLKKIVK